MIVVCPEDKFSLRDLSAADNTILDHIIVGEHQQTYAEVVTFRHDTNKICIKMKNITYNTPGNIQQNQPRITSESFSDIDGGVIGVERKRNKTTKFFLTGVAESVKECEILSYLKQRNITPTYISIFQSRR